MATKPKSKKAIESTALATMGGSALTTSLKLVQSSAGSADFANITIVGLRARVKEEAAKTQQEHDTIRERMGRAIADREAYLLKQANDNAHVDGIEKAFKDAGADVRAIRKVSIGKDGVVYSFVALYNANDGDGTGDPKQAPLTSMTLGQGCPDAELLTMINRRTVKLNALERRLAKLAAMGTREAEEDLRMQLGARLSRAALGTSEEGIAALRVSDDLVEQAIASVID